MLFVLLSVCPLPLSNIFKTIVARHSCLCWKCRKTRTNQNQAINRLQYIANDMKLVRVLKSLATYIFMNLNIYEYTRIFRLSYCQCFLLCQSVFI